MRIEGVIFDLDGVIVSTDDYHYEAWKTIADDEGIHFDRDVNERLRGVSRMESLEIILEKASRTYTDEEKVALAEKKNNCYKKLLESLNENDILPGVKALIKGLEEQGIKIAIGSSSRNTPFILSQIGMSETFEAVADGNQITRSKPDPEVFLLAADKLNIEPEKCLVVEDADAGIEAALAGGMRALGVGYASNNDKAHMKAGDLSQVTVEYLIDLK